MAMNKKEQAEFDAAKKAVFVARALNWTESVSLDVPVPKKGETRGYVFNEMGSPPYVAHALSSTIGHATSWLDPSPPKKTTSQRPIPMYSTELLALKALRHALENRYAETLAKIDMQIAALQAGTAQGSEP